jgi:hypothetical protein
MIPDMSPIQPMSNGAREPVNSTIVRKSGGSKERAEKPGVWAVGYWILDRR